MHASSAGQTTTVTGPDGTVTLHPAGNEGWRIEVQPAAGHYVPRTSWITAYPLDLILAIRAAKGIWVCDEIMREEDPAYVEQSLRFEVLGYLPPEQFNGRRLLDFGCGAGASTVILDRLLPNCELVGVELEEALLRIARKRAQHFGLGHVRFLHSPSATSLPEGLGLFDYVLFSAVFEHLLPHERLRLLPLIWSHLKVGGVLFLNQTPHRYAPIEVHTTKLPLINYLPDALAMRFAHRFAKLVQKDESWEKMLKNGIRGGTVSEVLDILRTTGKPVLLEPLQGDRIDLWYAGLSRRRMWAKKGIRLSLKALKAFTSVEAPLSLALAIRKEG